MFGKSKTTSRIETIIGAGTEFEGNIRTTQSIRIDGKIKGEIHADGVILGETGVLLGDITATSVTIAGKIKGNVFASASLELLAKAQILGDIKTNKLSIADGATFEGNCQMLKSDGQVLEINPNEIPSQLEENGARKLKVISGNGKH